tara:strand:+ start:115 stop:432 length:318 start_codon:yes stop_codon:yes gene_type:complete
MSFSINDNVISDISVFASVVSKLYKNNLITQEIYTHICKKIVDIIKSSDQVEFDILYNDLKDYYSKYSWWSLHKLFNTKKRSSKKKRLSTFPRKIKKSPLSVVSY